MALYPYTLQPVPLNLSDAEFMQAQHEIFQQSTPSSSLKTVTKKEWAIIAVVVVLAIVGLVFVDGYSTLIFWLMLVLVVAYLLARTLGMKWYVQREYEKQMAKQEMPDEMRSLKLGVQKHGLIMAMPNPNAPTTTKQKGKGAKAMRGMQMRGATTQQATIPWSAVTSWDETADYLFLMFEFQGQQGSQIIPKRLANDKFPIDTVRTHLKEVVPIRGLRPESVVDMKKK